MPAGVTAMQAVTPPPKPLTLPAQMPRVSKVSARASSSWDMHTPSRAFDGDRNTIWNAGNYAPQWLEADLGTSMLLGSISLVVIQLPEGETTHEIWVSDEAIGGDCNPGLRLLLDPARPHLATLQELQPMENPAANRAKLAHTFHGHTQDNQVLTFHFPKGMFARFVQIRTTQSPSWVAWVDVELCAQSRPSSVKEGAQ